MRVNRKTSKNKVKRILGIILVILLIIVGLYGEQEGDGQATISPEEQLAITTQQIQHFIADEADLAGSQ